MPNVFDTPEYRLDGPLKVTGRASYTADLRLPGLLRVKFLLSPYPHARIVSIDTVAARRLPGVHAVVTGADIGERRFGRFVFDWPALATRLTFTYKRHANGDLDMKPVLPMDRGDRFNWAADRWRRVGPPLGAIP